MLELGAPKTRVEIETAFAAEHTAVHDFFAAIPDERFFAAPAAVWTPADNLVHLTLSSKPLVLGLRVPRIALRLRYGVAEHASRSLAKVRTQYTEVALAGGAVATGAYLPLVKAQTPAMKRQVLAEWAATGHKLERALTRWSEGDLDRLVGPHPLLGTMTIRELLFFTLYHNLHHVRDVQALLELPLDEWFDPILTTT